MSDLTQQIALTALNDMMSKGHFNICTIDRVAELLGVQLRGSAAYKALGPLHCIDWARMPQEVRDAVPGLIQECLGIAPVFQFKTAQQRVIDITPYAEPKPERKGFLRLLGGKA
jgi:hypothetical protein